MDPDLLVRLVGDAVRELDLDVIDAIARPPDGLGDVRALLRNGSRVWFEVKAQTAKPRFADLTQADWVRDETDFLRWLFYNEQQFAGRMPRWMVAALSVGRRDEYFRGWNRDSLWLADMALITNRRARLNAEVDTPQSLRTFLERKFVLHLTQEGIRVIRLSLAGPVASVLSGGPVALWLNFANKTAAAVVLASPGPVGRGEAQFSYHVGYPSRVIGRHKMHARSLAQGPNTIECLA